MSITEKDTHQPIAHPGEPQSNAIRARLAAVEPPAQRTYTPSMAVLARSAGAYHWTPEGRKLADFTSGVLVANLGHNPKSWWKRVWSYLGLEPGDGNTEQPAGDYLTAMPLCAYNAVTELETEACERLLASLQSQPGGGRCEQVLWAASGSEAIQKALWAALDLHTGSDPIVLATRCGFHGKKGLAGAVTGTENDPDRDFRVRFISFPTEECCSVQRRGQPIDLAPYEAEFEAMLTEYGSRLCALITEPYLGGGGSFHPQPEYLQMIERFCRKNNLVFIFDEVQANFGRTGPMYAFTHYGVEPDVVVLGKGLGNGVPVSAAVGPAALFAKMHYGEASDTWSANPLASAAVLATLDEFETAGVLEHARELSQIISRGLSRLTELDVVEQIRGEGVVWGVECSAVGSHTAGDVANACVEACYLGDDTGRAIHLLGPLAECVIRVSPPLTMAHDEAENYLSAMFDMFAAVGERLKD